MSMMMMMVMPVSRGGLLLETVELPLMLFGDCWVSGLGAAAALPLQLLPSGMNSLDCCSPRSRRPGIAGQLSQTSVCLQQPPPSCKALAQHVHSMGITSGVPELAMHTAGFHQCVLCSLLAPLLMQTNAPRKCVLLRVPSAWTLGHCQHNSPQICSAVGKDRDIPDRSFRRQQAARRKHSRSRPPPELPGLLPMPKGPPSTEKEQAAMDQLVLVSKACRKGSKLQGTALWQSCSWICSARLLDRF
eukprot:1146540-Pelagomonas_calceolata.AAC.4